MGPTFGRDVELEVIDRFLSRVAEGTPVLVVEGDPGIGKTTLWLEGVERARARSFRVLKASPAESEAKLPYAALGDLVGEAFSEVGSALPEPQRQALGAALLLAKGDQGADVRTTATAVVNIVTKLAAERPVVIAIDDVQWLDSASARALAFAVRRLPEKSAVLLARRPQAAADLPLGLTAARERVEILTVRPLSLAALHGVIRSRLGTSLARPVLVRLATASDGNPFFALEMARMMSPDVDSSAQSLPLPSSLREVVAGHVRGLSSAALEAVQIAAALSRPAMPAIATALGSEARAVAALSEAEEAGIVVLDGDRIRFAHPLLASGVYLSLTATRRRQLHARLALLTDEIEERARHLALSETKPDEGTAEQLEVAGRQAAMRGAHEAATEFLEAACRITPTDQPLALARRMVRQGAMSLANGNVEGARKVATEAVAIAPIPAMRAQALTLLGDTAWVEGLSQRAVEHLEAALAEAGTDRELASTVLSKLVEVSAVLDPVRALDYSQKAMEHVSGERHPGLLAQALYSHVWAQALLGRPPEVELFERGLKLEAEAGPGARPSHMPLIWYNATDNFTAAKARHEADQRWFREHGDELGAADRLAAFAYIELRAGHWDRAESDVERSYTTMEHLTPGPPSTGPRFTVRNTRALIDAHRGRTNRARSALIPMLESSANPQQSFWAALLLASLAFVEFSEGRHEAVDQAVTAMQQRLDMLGAVEIPNIRSEQFHVESLLALGRLDRAHAVMEQLEARGRTFPRAWITIALTRIRALVTAADGDLAGALDGMARGDSAAAERSPFEHGRNLLVYGQLLRRAKQRRAAADALGKALAVFEDIGAPTWSAQARSELERVGLRKAPESLTPTELRVVELAARGMTNREVAAQLFISPKTVEANLARAYGKLGISSRAELGARARELDSTR